MDSESDRPGLSREATTGKRENKRGVRINLLRFLLPGKLRDASGLALIFLGVLMIGAFILFLVALIAFVVQRSGESADFVAPPTDTATAEYRPAELTATATSSPTRLPQPTMTVGTPVLTPAPSAGRIVPGAMVRVVGTGEVGLRLRSGPGLDYVTTTVVAEGSNLEVLEGPVSGDDIDWWRLESTEGVVGWAAGDFLSPEEDE